MRREDDGLGPLEAMFEIASAPANRVHRPRIDQLLFVSAVIVASDVAAIRTGVNDLGVSGVRRDVAALSAAHGVPVRPINCAVGPRASDADG